MRKVKLSALVVISQKDYSQGGWGVGQGAVWQGQTAPKTGNEKSFGAARSPGLALSSSIIMMKINVTSSTLMVHLLFQYKNSVARVSVNINYTLQYLQ